jgi:hypothetical protein
MGRVLVAHCVIPCTARDLRFLAGGVISRSTHCQDPGHSVVFKESLDQIIPVCDAETVVHI